LLAGQNDLDEAGFAVEIESTLLNHEHILEVAVVGVEDKIRGEAVTAFLGPPFI
jgi:non-ribosomal peptide synthetase component E (peptide arylation enzyme)